MSQHSNNKVLRLAEREREIGDELMQIGQALQSP